MRRAESGLRQQITEPFNHDPRSSNSNSARTKVKRGNTMASFSEVSKFSDGLMDYEISRMMGNN
jgi:hypothetical protein